MNIYLPTCYIISTLYANVSLIYRRSPRIDIKEKISMLSHRLPGQTSQTRLQDASANLTHNACVQLRATRGDSTTSLINYIDPPMHRCTSVHTTLASLFGSVMVFAKRA